MKKIILFLSFVLIVFLVGIYFVFWPKARFNLVAEAAGGIYPTIFPPDSISAITFCQLTSPPVVKCVGSELCLLRDPLRCEGWEQLDGEPSGVGVSSALFLANNVTMVGGSIGGQLIAGGMTPSEMDLGVIAGPSGCIGSGCAVISDKNIFQKYYEIIKYGIASLKDKQ